MSNEMIGNAYKYIVDTSYGINKDGFIAIGTESIVYKGLKIKRDGGLQFSCVLKFKPKSIVVDGEVIDRVKVFKTEEWKIFQELKECRSIVRIEDIVEELGDFSLSCDKVVSGVINQDAYFCVVEEFIDGWSLDEFCQEEYWKLRKIERLENGLNHVMNYHAYEENEKKAIQISYHYDNILKYQNQLILFMINLCEIMEFVTEQKNILHLDIKPDNIMVTRHGKELVLIDFGRSKKVTQANRFAMSDQKAADYSQNETLERMYQYGTLGYAAPECYAKATRESSPPFSKQVNQGAMSIESDIFSFGTTFWECFHIFELITKSELFTRDSHDFYRQHFLNDATYCNRNLSCTSLFYHKKIETILKKCTKKRMENYTDLDHKEFYHSYKELQKDLDNAKNSVPTIEKDENVKVKNAFRLCGSMFAFFGAFLVLFFIYRLMGFNIAQEKWTTLTENYNDTQFYKLEMTATDMIDTAPANQLSDTYEKIAGFTYHGNDISDYEAALLVDLLQEVDEEKALAGHVNEIMQNANTRKFKEISTELMKLDVKGKCKGYELAKAIYNVEVGKTEIIEGYQVLKKYEKNKELHNAVVKLKNVLDNDDYIKTIAEKEKISRPEVQEFFKKIGNFQEGSV